MEVPFLGVFFLVRLKSGGEIKVYQCVACTFLFKFEKDVEGVFRSDVVLRYTYAHTYEEENDGPGKV